MLPRILLLLVGALGVSILSSSPSVAAESWREISCKDYLFDKGIELTPDARPRRSMTEEYSVEALSNGALTRTVLTYRTENTSATCEIVSLVGTKLVGNGYKVLKLLPTAHDSGVLKATGETFELPSSTTYAYSNAPLQALLEGNEEILTITGGLTSYDSVLTPDQAQAAGHPEWAGEHYGHKSGPSTFSFELSGLGPERTIKVSPEAREAAKTAYMNKKTVISHKFKNRVLKVRLQAERREWSKKTVKTKIRGLKKVKATKLARAKAQYRSAIADRRERTPWVEVIESE